MTLPARKIQMPPHPEGETPTRSRRAAGTYTQVDNDALNILMTTGTAYTRVLSALLSRSNYTHISRRTLSLGDLMTMTGLGASAVEKQLRVLKSEGRCMEGGNGYGYQEVKGPRLAREPSKRGRYDRQLAAARREATQAAEGHNRPYTRPDTYPHNYAFSDPKSPVLDVVFLAPEEVIEGSLYISTTTDTDTRAEGTLAGEGQVAEAGAVVVVVGEAAPDSEQHPPVGGAADAANTDSAAPVQDFHDQDPEMQEKPATSTENVPPAAAPLAPRTRPELAAASAAHPVPASLNRLLWPDWVTAFAAIEGAGLSGTWTRWQAHVGGNASQQLAQAERWADWVGAGLADALRLQVPETIADTSVRSPARHLAGAMTNRAEEARRAPAPAPTSQAAAHDGPVVAPVAGQRRVDPRTGEIWTVESIAYGQVTFEEVAAPSALRVATVATWEVAL